MKPIECKNCGSSEIVKGSGFYFCRSCGTRYTIEDIEGQKIAPSEFLQTNDNTIRHTAHLYPKDETYLKRAFVEYLINLEYVPVDIFSSLKKVKVVKSYVPVYLVNVNWNVNWSALFYHGEEHQEQTYDLDGRVTGVKTVYDTIARSANGMCSGTVPAAISANGSHNEAIVMTQVELLKGELKVGIPNISEYPNENFSFRLPQDSLIMETIHPIIGDDVCDAASRMMSYNEELDNCDYHISSISIDSIDLIYVPFWRLRYIYKSKEYEASINASNGCVYAAPPEEDNIILRKKQERLDKRSDPGRMLNWYMVPGMFFLFVLVFGFLAWAIEFDDVALIIFIVCLGVFVLGIIRLIVQLNINKRLKKDIEKLQTQDIATRRNRAFAVFGKDLNNVGAEMRLNGEINNSSSHLVNEDAEECVAEHSECNNTVEIQPSVEAKSTLSNQANVSSVEKSNNHRIMWLIIVLLLLGVAGGGLFYYTNIYLPQKRDAEAPRYYTFANSVRMRSSADFDVEYNKLESFGYGTEVIVYDSMPGNYFYGKVAPKDARGKVIKDRVVEGYIAYQYLLPEEDFFRLNGVFGNEEAKEMLNESRYRRALLNYLKSHNYCGKITAEQIAEHSLNSNLNSAEQWQVFCKDKASKSNTVYRSRKYNRHSKYPDLAVIIKNVRSGERRLLYFIFDDETETPELMGEQAAPAQGYMVDGTLTLDDWGHDGVDVYVRYTNRPKELVNNSHDGVDVYVRYTN